MTPKREIYYIIFNKHINGDGKFEADSYQLEIESAFGGKVPEKISLVGNKITVVFNDGVRHIFNYDKNTDYFDRPIEKKDAKETTDNTN